MSAPKSMPEPSPRDRELQASCLVSLRRFQDAARKAGLPPRKKQALLDRLHFLLHYLVAQKGRSLADATHEDINEWLAPAVGLHEYDVRFSLFQLLGEYED